MEDEKRAQAPNVIEEIARAVGGTITEVGGPLPDGSGFAIMSMPLPKTHWIYQRPDAGSVRTRLSVCADALRRLQERGAPVR